MRKSIVARLLALFAWVEALASGMGGLGHTLSAHTRKLRVKGQRGQLGLGTLLAAFVIVIAVFVVVLVVDKFDESLGAPQSSDLNNSSNDVISGFASMTSLVEPLLLIAIGVVIISLIRRVQ